MTIATIGRNSVCVSVNAEHAGRNYARRTLASAILVASQTEELPEHDIVANLHAANSAFQGTGAALRELEREAASLGCDVLVDVTWAGPGKRPSFCCQECSVS